MHDAVRSACASPYYGSGRPMLPFAVGGSKEYLVGEVAGDYGFDPLGLAEDSSALLKYTEFEVRRTSGAFL